MAMNNSPAVIVALGAVATLAAFVCGHFLYAAGSQKTGYLIGVMAMAPLALAVLQVWRSTGKSWAKILFSVVTVLWAALLVFSMM